MLTIIIGNILSATANLSDAYSSTKKTKREILLIQCVSQIFYAAGSIVLKGYSATAQNLFSILRNLFAAYNKKSKILEFIFIVGPVILGIYLNNLGLVGYLPIVANLVYSIAMFVFKGDPIILKCALVFVCLSFSIFNFVILNFVGVVACLISAFTAIVSIIKDKKSNKIDNE